ncbi:unnamed protein product [Bathycoccus prasinos]|jgi:hypothetical protein|tara:strand:- start:977 stop:1417 length:441 start_codon:yes stop_codon:yes gene_type:complete
MLKAETKRIKLIVISIGTEERARDFCRENEFPMEILYADPINVTYDKLRLNFGVKETLFDASTPYSIAERIREGKIKELTDVLKRWKPWIPPKREQGLQQGGTFVFDTKRIKGDSEVEYECVYDWYDPSTGAHAPAEEILEACGIE